MKDFYYILEIDVACSSDEVKEAYRKLSKKFNPDLNTGDSYFDIHFREINEAYETLIDPDKRYRYDKAFKKIKFRRQSTNNAVFYRRTHTSSRSEFQSFKTGRFGPGMRITLILVAVIFGVYLTVSLISSKKHKTIITPVADSPVLLKASSHHKRKHRLKNNQPEQISKAILDSTNPHPKRQKTQGQKIAAVKDSVPQKANSNTIQQITANNNSPVAAPSNNYLYSTYVKPNITGIVNIRESDSYNSPIIGSVHENSKIFVLKKGNFYYKISFNDKIGYVPRWSLEVK